MFNGENALRENQNVNRATIIEYVSVTNYCYIYSFMRESKKTNKQTERTSKPESTHSQSHRDREIERQRK